MAVIKAINPGSRSLNQGIKYISNPEKTEKGFLISGKDCDAQSVLDEMKATKELYGKTDGRQYKHFIQSFNPEDQLNPSQAHQIGYEMAQKAFPGYEVLVTTHTDKDHLHNHLIVNSVSFENGSKYRQSISELQEIKELSNRICEREGLHVMSKEKQTPGKALSMNEYQVAMKGQSWKSKLMDEIDKSMKTSNSKEDFVQSMEDKNYGVNWSDNRKYITYTTPEGKKSRDNKLHDVKYSKESMKNEFTIGRIKKIELQPQPQPRSTNERGQDRAEQYQATKKQIIRMYSKEFPAIRHISEKIALSIDALNTQNGQPLSIKAIKKAYMAAGKNLEADSTDANIETFDKYRVVVDGVKQAQHAEKKEEAKEKALLNPSKSRSKTMEIGNE